MNKIIYLWLIIINVLLASFFLPIKISSEVKAEAAESQIKGKYQTGTLLVKFRPEIKNSIDAANQKVNLPSVDHLNRKYALTNLKALFPSERHQQDVLGSIYKLTFLSSSTIEELLSDYQNNPVVEYAEPDYFVNSVRNRISNGVKAQFIPNDPYFESDQWNFTKVNAEEAWNYDSTTPKYGGDPSIVVAVLDSGVAYEDYTDPNPGHCYDNVLVECIDANAEYAQAPDLAQTNFVDGYDFINDDTHPNDDYGHGTHVTGTIAQSTNNNLGVAGLAFNSSIMPVKVLDNAGFGLMSDIAQGVDFAVESGANIINLSLGGDEDNNTLQLAVEDALAQGIIIVAATGNTSDRDANPPEVDSLLYPAAYEGVIAVGATGEDDEIADYSNSGTGIDLVAPGGNGSSYIRQNTYSNLDENPPYLPLDFVTFGNVGYQGTSMATSHVSGAAALLLAYGVETTNIQDILQSSAEDLGSIGYDTTFGYGRLDIQTAFSLVAGDDTAPTNPTIRGYDSEEKESELVDGGRYEYPTPYFEWSGAEDALSGIAGYYLYFGINANADPYLDGSFTTDTNYTHPTSLEGQDDIIYYLRIMTEDNEGNITREVAQFIYIIDTKAEMIVTGAGPGGGPQVRIFEQDGTLLSQFFAYNSTFRGGVNVAIGDLDGDGKNEIVTGPGPGGGPQVRVFDDHGNLKFTPGFFAYAEHVRNGVYVAVGYLNGDDDGEIITGTGAGSGPHVRTFDRYGNPVFTPGFFAYGENVRNGVYVTAGDLDGDEIDEIITGTGPGSGPHVRAFDYLGNPIFTPGFFPYAENFRGGVRVAVGDLDNNGKEEILTAPGTGGGPQVRAFNRYGAPIVTNGFFAFDPNFHGGIFLAGGDTNQDGLEEIIVSVGQDSSSLVRVFNQTGSAIISEFLALPETFLNGTNIASGTVN